jgi:hypothetical protein
MDPDMSGFGKTPQKSRRRTIMGPEDEDHIEVREYDNYS